jgi:phosphatidylserine/phosphatidylglycerophosphate/cardiolipin synthase-like enzyme
MLIENWRSWSLCLILTAGCTAPAGTELEVADGIDDVAFVDGKTDGLWGPCEETSVLQWVNAGDISVDDLKQAGVHTRAAKNIFKTRVGPDGFLGTTDDDIFETLRDLDSVSYVGPVAMRQLREAVESSCATDPANTEVIFSPQLYDASHLTKIVSMIDGAQTSIDLAMYSMRDARVSDALRRAVDRGVSIRVIFEPANADRLSPDGTRSAALEDDGIDVRYVNKIMHHKFAIIDGPVEMPFSSSQDAGALITGSGNWSYGAATRYDENTVFHYGQTELNLRFQKEFNYLWANSRDFEWNAALAYYETDSIDESDIVDQADVSAVFTSANFRTYQSSRYGNTFSVVRGHNEVADTLVSLIADATDSIYVASGHLRSRPVSEALLAKAEQDPSIDIKIYLDGQEYVSEWTHRKEVRALEDCLVAAGESQSKKQDCVDRGYHCSFDMHQAGIPLRFKFYSYRWHYSYAKQMHHKYLLIDGDTLVSGSYNLSDNAEHNTMENMVVYQAPTFAGLISDFGHNFSNMWSTGLQDDLLGSLQDDLEHGTGRVPLVFDSMALSWNEVRDLKSAIGRACPDANTQEFRENPKDHQYCDR